MDAKIIMNLLQLLQALEKELVHAPQQLVLLVPVSVSNAVMIQNQMQVSLMVQLNVPAPMVGFGVQHQINVSATLQFLDSHF